MGDRAAYVARQICECDAQIRVGAIADVQPPGLVRERLAQRRVPTVDDVPIFADPGELLKRLDQFDGLIIATPCHLHAPLAIRAAASGVPLFLEKPVATSWQQVEALRAAYAGREGSVVVSFPLRLTRHVQTATEIVRSGRLGIINQVQAVNNVSYGGVYYGQWYREYELTGGLWLQKATHDFDYVTYMLGAVPLRITAMHGRLAYGGDMPPDLRCSRCDLTETCPESPKNLLARGDDGGTLNHTRPTPDADHACTFSRSILHQDAGSAIILYGNGVHAAYTQNFLPRRGAGLRGATVIGYDATLTFAWQRDTLQVIDHHRDHVEEVPVRATGGHGGGDEQLAQNFVDVMRHRASSRAPLDDGLLSAAMCLAARDAAATGVTQPIPLFGRGRGDDDQRGPLVRGAAEVEPV